MANVANGRVGDVNVLRGVSKRKDYLSDATPGQAAAIVGAGVLLLGFFLWLADEANVVMGMAQ